MRATIFSFSGREISYQDLDAGGMFGKLSAIDRGPRTTHVIALEDSVIGSMGAKDFSTVMSQYPVVADAVMGRLVSLVRFCAIGFLSLVQWT